VNPGASEPPLISIEGTLAVAAIGLDVDDQEIAARSSVGAPLAGDR